jgi:hypothetical protein
MAFLRWCDEYISRRKRQCVFKRPTTYYVAANGDDSRTTTQAQSPSTPWQTYAKVISHIGANSGGNYSILFRRGDTFRSATGLSLTAPNVHFGAYGPLPTSGIDAPIISHFSVQWPSGGTRWSLVSGDVWQASVTAGTTTNPSGATSVGFIRVAEDPLNPLIAQPGAAQVGLNDLSFAVSGSTVYINVQAYGVTNPNDLNIEAVPVKTDPSPDGISINNGSTGVWIDGLRFDGWGAGSQGLTANQTNANASGVRNLAGGTAAEAEHVAYISNCECYYYGAHAFSQEPGGIGGTHIVENCIAGFGYDAVNGLTVFNSYAGGCQQETVFRNCTVRFGALPQQIGTGGRTVAFGSALAGKAFFGHTSPNPTQPVSLVLIMDCQSLDERTSDNRVTAIGPDVAFQVDPAGGNLNAGLSLTDPAAQRVFFIGYKMPRSRTGATSTPVIGFPYGVFINCHLYVRKNWTGGSPNFIFDTFNSFFINTVFEVEAEGGDTVGMFRIPTVPSAGPRMMNCLVIVRGHTNYSGGAGTESRFHFTNANSQDRLRLANTIVIADRWRDGSTIVAGSGLEAWLARDTFGDAAKNDTNSIRNVAVAGCGLSNSSPWLGFNAATGFLNLATANNSYPDVCAFSGDGSGARRLVTGVPYVLDPASPLAGAGSANPFADKSDMLPAPEYDFFGRRRPATPSIGPVDVVSTSSGGGASGISGGRAIVRSPVRPAAG